MLQYLSRFPEKVNLVNPLSGQTALGNAAKGGRIKSVRLLLHYGADPNLPDICGKTPFLQAVIHKHYEIAILMTSYGAKTNIDFSFRSKKYHSILDFLLYGPYSRRDEESYKEETLKSISERQNEPLKQALILLIQKQNTSCSCSQISHTKMKLGMVPKKNCIKKYSRQTPAFVQQF